MTPTFLSVAEHLEKFAGCKHGNLGGGDLEEVLVARDEDAVPRCAGRPSRPTEERW